jgi:hypothetical protein
VSLSDDFENELSKFLFQNVSPPHVPGGLTTLYVALHTADPGETGIQTTNETSYTNYARVAVSRDASGFSVLGGVITNVADVVFPVCGATGATLTHFSIQTTASGSAGSLVVSGPLTSSFVVSTSIQPKFAAGQLVVTGD